MKTEITPHHRTTVLHSPRLCVSARVILRGFVAVDMLFGIIIVMSVTVTLLVTMRHVRAAEENLSDSRSALHLAEHALLNLQHGQPMPSISREETLTIRPASNGTAPSGYAWAKVEASVRGHTQSLLGVLPISSIPSNGVKP
jgi:hypothetical protein